VRVRLGFRLAFFFREPERAEGDSCIDLVLSVLVLRFLASVLYDRASSSVCAGSHWLCGTMDRFLLSSLRAGAFVLVWASMVISQARLLCVW
jgi:hypothetical protein